MINFNITHLSTVTQAYYPCKEWDPGRSPLVQPTLNYLAPENILSASCDISSDMFSLGVLFYAIFNNGKPLLDCRGEFSEFKQNCKRVSFKVI